MSGVVHVLVYRGLGAGVYMYIMTQIGIAPWHLIMAPAGVWTWSLEAKMSVIFAQNFKITL